MTIFDLIIVFRIANPYNILRQITNLPQLSNSWSITLPPKTILSVFLPYSFVLPYKRKTKGRRRGKESDNERCSIEPTQALGTWGTFVGIIAKGGEWWRRMRFGSRRSFVILQPKQNYPKSVIRVYGRLVNPNRSLEFMAD